MKIFYHFLTILFSFFPMNVQKMIYQQCNIGSKQIQFIVEPNSVWLGYIIKNSSKVEDLLPENLELDKISVFGEVPQYYLFFNFFRVSSEVLSGLRLEIVTIGREKNTNKYRFVILDYLTDTVSSDPNIPFKRWNQKDMMLLDMDDYLFIKANDDYFALLKKGQKKNVLKQFSIDPNKYIYYQKNMVPNQLDFDVNEVLDTYDYEMIYNKNNLWNNTIDEKIAITFFYPNQTNFMILPSA